jgi:hypothetical protein
MLSIIFNWFLVFYDDKSAFLTLSDSLQIWRYPKMKIDFNEDVQMDNMLGATKNLKKM